MANYLYTKTLIFISLFAVAIANFITIQKEAYGFLIFILITLSLNALFYSIFTSMIFTFFRFIFRKIGKNYSKADYQLHYSLLPATLLFLGMLLIRTQDYVDHQPRQSGTGLGMGFNRFSNVLSFQFDSGNMR